MTEVNAIRLIRRKAMLLAILGIFVSGVLVAVVTAVPMYQSAREGLERSTLMGVQAQGAALDNLVQRYEGIARQITSRTEIRRHLERYVDGELPIGQLVSFTNPRLAEALESEPALRGIKRLGPMGEVIVDQGDGGVMPDLSRLSDLHGIESQLVRVDGTVIWRTIVPIVDDLGLRVGTDVMFFEVDNLVDLLQRTRTLEPSARGFLVDRDVGRVVGIDPASGKLVISSARDVLSGGVSRIDPTESGVVWPNLDRESGVLFHTPVGGGRCLLLVEAGFWTFYQPVIMRLLWPLGLVFLLLPIVAWLSARALRPVLQRLTEQSEELEHSAGELRLAASVFDGTGEAIMITSPNHRLLRVNPAFTRITGFEAGEVVGRPMTDLFQLDEADSARLDAICSRLGRDHSWEGEMDYRNRRGERMTALQTISQVIDSQGRVSHYIHIFNDITETKAAQRQIRHLAHHDALTDLPNRASLRFRIEQAIERAGVDGGRMAVLFLDLDFFKDVNDRLGHAVGDRLLREVAERLRQLLRHEDTVGRLGGDEFLILLEGLPAAHFAGQVARKVIEVLTRPFVIDGESIQIGVSVGIAVFPGQAVDADGLIGHADAAMYEAKAAGRDTYRYFDRGAGTA
ncbi:sensor domain-containing diguanylate cyclase [Guyparkeria hydrothermalis]|uniref:sensor domain-containing diguanylate cyclase n=1 Tax=Guyparkeria hydrothermalis TaxID=923 RepID=UPI00201FE36D|nr:sensor domain-containing diguanylate cyclase [Guyparkeria hydrothermalis]MCL7745227.1 sensor domain-containing diguanylate cyclase [Guyparkeria hydrothermalis]